MQVLIEGFRSVTQTSFNFNFLINAQLSKRPYETELCTCQMNNTRRRVKNSDVSTRISMTRNKILYMYIVYLFKNWPCIKRYGNETNSDS